MTLVTSSASYGAPNSVAGIVIPDSKLAREVTELVKDTESPLLFRLRAASITGVRSPASAAASASNRTPLRRRHVPRHGPYPHACERA